MGEKRKTGASKSDSDTEIHLPFIPTKKHRSENGKSVKGKSVKKGPTVTTSQPTNETTDIEDSDSCSEVDFPLNLKQRALVLENSNGRTQSSYGGEDLDSRPDSGSDDIPLKLKRRALALENLNGPTQFSHGGHKPTDDVDIMAEAIQGPKRAATQLKEVSKARVSFASARTTPNLKPFVPLDPASIRRGFQEGGANSKKEDLKKGTYIMLIKMAKTKLILAYYSYSFCLRGDSVLSPSSTFFRGTYV